MASQQGDTPGRALLRGQALLFVGAHNVTVTSRTAVQSEEPGPSECWCCGAVDDPVRMIHLGNHPEVALCVRCGHWAVKQAWAIEDRAKTGPLVMARDRFRALRRKVIDRGWQHNRIIGGPLRWLGKRLP